MDFPLSLWDLSLWFAVMSVILLLTSELVSPHYGRINLLINRKRLRNISLTMGILFLATGAIRIIDAIITI